MPNGADHDLAVIGGGSGGFGTALAASRRGLRVLLVEALPALGGASTLGGVNTWEPSVGGPGLPFELHERLAHVPNTIGVGRTVHFSRADERYGLSRIDRAIPYRDSLRRSGFDGPQWRRVTFEPDAMVAAMCAMLLETGRVELALGARFVGAEVEGELVTGLKIDVGGRERSVSCRFVVDATGDLAVASAVGCGTYLGAEPKSMYGEPSAPEEHLDELNGVTLCYRVTPGVAPARGELHGDDYERGTSINEYPCGDLNLNPLPIMEGWEFHCLGPARGRAECEARTRRHWGWLQRTQGFDGYRFCHSFPVVGVREGPRLVGRQVLTENDVRSGCSGQGGEDRWIALCDHAIDTHGRGGGCVECREPYAVPYECLLPREYDNLAVACRGASFSHIAASSCRLSRVMMGLGQAAGLAAAVAKESGAALPEVDVRRVRQWLAEDNVALDPADERFPQP